MIGDSTEGAAYASYTGTVTRVSRAWEDQLKDGVIKGANCYIIPLPVTNHHDRLPYGELVAARVSNAGRGTVAKFAFDGGMYELISHLDEYRRLSPLEQLATQCDDPLYQNFAEEADEITPTG